MLLKMKEKYVAFYTENRKSINTFISPFLSLRKEFCCAIFYYTFFI